MSHYTILHYTMACYTVRNSLAIKNSVWYTEIIAFKSQFPRYMVGHSHSFIPHLFFFFPVSSNSRVHMWVRVDC